MKLFDLIKLFSLLQELLEVVDIDFDDSIYSVKDLSKFPTKISEQRLFEYFLQRTTFSQNQIRSFLKIIAFKLGERINFWDRPLVIYKGCYYFNFLANISPIVLNLLDYWFEQAEYSLDLRDRLLENYLKNTLNSVLKKNGTHFKIPNETKIYNEQKKFEEIDLIINLAEVIVVAEVKCIKYPLEPRDRHNSMKILIKAARQVKRKIESLKKYQHDVSPTTGLFNNKEIIPLINTNYPTFSGYSIDLVPICDFYLLESYFRSDKFTYSKINTDWTTETIAEKLYYKSETKMNKNLKNFLQIHIL